MIVNNHIPYGALIQISKLCNYRCSHCSQKAPHFRINSHLPELSLNELETILDRLRSTGMTQVRFTGGEPFLHNDLELLCQKALELDLSVSLVTNGSLIFPNNIGWLEKVQPKEIWLSIYGFPAEIYENVTGINGTFSHTTSMIYQLIRKLPKVGLYYPIGNNNYKHIGEFIRYFYSLGVRHIKFPQIMGQGRATDSKEPFLFSFDALEWTLDCIVESILDCPEMRIQVSMRSGQTQLFASKGFLVPEERSCHVGLQNLWTINSIGSVFPCCLFMNEKKPVLFNLLSSEEFSNWRQWDYLEVLKLLGIQDSIVRSCPALPNRELSESNVFDDFICPLMYGEIRS